MRVLVLAHRHELLHQAEEKFRLMWGAQDLSVGWVKGKRKEFGGQVSTTLGLTRSGRNDARHILLC
jgi:superfamily II DNA or RNA helicase